MTIAESQAKWNAVVEETAARWADQFDEMALRDVYAQLGFTPR